MPNKKSAGADTVTAIFIFTAVYFLAGKFGLSLAIVHPSASAIWPPSGIALAALLLWGYRLWPGVFLGAFLVNITTQGALLVSMAIASGNTLEALLGAALINRFANGPKVFERARNTFKFVLLAALISTAVSATVGVSSLVLGGHASWSQYNRIWLTWWLGDATGDLLVAPLLVIWLTQPRPSLTPARILESSGLLLALITACYFVFLGETSHALASVAILPLLWAAFRFGQRGAVTAAFFTAGIALAGTLDGMGPFASGTSHPLHHLQIFAGTIAIAALVLASVVTERMRAEQRLEIQEAVSRILADSPHLKDAGRRILEVLCGRAKWSTGAIWHVDETANALVCVDFWHSPAVEVARFEAVSRQQRFALGVGLPGRVWSSGNAVWIPDVIKDGNFPPAQMAAMEGLRAAFGFPIKVADELCGVIECFSREVRDPDDDFLRMAADIGDQLGRFIEQKRAGNDIAVLNQRLRAILDTAADGIITFDEDSIITSANTAAERIFGYTAAEIIGQHLGLIMPGAYRPELNARRRDLPAYEGKIVGIGREVQGRRKDRTTFPVDLAVSETRFGEYLGFTGIVRDITERKRTESLLTQAKEELLQANQRLEQNVQQRTADLEQANAALLQNVEQQHRLEEQLRQAQKMESIGTLAGGIAHDFNNTLNIIRAYATLVSAQSPTDPQIVASMTTINQEVERGAAVVRQLMTLARKAETRLAHTDANQVVVTVSELIKQTFPRTIDVRLKLDRKLSPVLADSNQINQALLNICVNARDAMPLGGTLTLATEMLDEKTMQRRHPEAVASSHVCIAISDTGTGMEESVSARIFEPFFTTKGFGEGTGLGLAMVYGIMKNHHGLIDVESEPNHGTTFHLYLPAIPPGDQSIFHEATGAKAPGQISSNPKATVFVVEDEQPMVRLLRNALTRKGYRVLIAVDGAQAIDTYQRHKDEIDIVLMDLGLPKVAGSEVIRLMKEQDRSVKIIVTTGYIEPELKSELFGTGVKDYIQKPYSVDEILEKLESAFAYS